MLNNLAASFQSSIIRKNEKFDVQSTKRQKTDINPSYLLNFCCPRSSYDLYFESTKTIVEFKDWQTVLSFIEQTVTNHWMKHALQSSKVADEASVDGGGIPLKRDGVKLNQSIRKHHNKQKEDSATFQSAQRKIAVRDTKFDMGGTEALKDSGCFSFDMEPSLCHASFGRTVNASQLNNNVTSIDCKFGYKQIHSSENGSYQLLEDDPSHLDDDISGVNSTSWQMQWTEGYQEHTRSGNFGMLEDGPTEGFLIREQESEFIGLKIEIQDPFFKAPNRPNHMFAHTSGRDGYCVEFNKLIESCLVNEATHEISESNDGFYHDYDTTSRSFCGVLRKCCTNTKLETVHPSVEGLEADNISQMNFPDIHHVWSSDAMDRSSIKDTFDQDDNISHINFPDIHPVWSSDVMGRPSVKDTFHHFSHPFSLLDTPFGQARTDLKYHWRSNKSFDLSNCANMNGEFGFTLDRFNNDPSIICEGIKHLDNSEYETQRLNYSKNDCCSGDQFSSEDDLTSWKSKFGARLSDDISRVRSANGSHLNAHSSKMVNGSTLAQDLPNKHNSGCNQRSSLSKDSRSRSHSAPPFYRGKQKFPKLTEPPSKSTIDGDKDICSNNQEDNAPTPMDISHMSATQPIPETDSSEFPYLNVSSNGYVKMCENACSDGPEDTTAQITKWRDDSVQQTALDLPQGPFGCCDDVLSISSGTLHLSCSSLVPECVDRYCFEEARVLLQLDKKFIPVISGETILLVDQHAADERIRLEDLRNKILSEGCGVTYLDSEEELSLPETGFQLFQKYAEQIQKWGWIINGDNTSSESFKKNMNILRRQSRLVTLVAVPCILGVNLTGKDLMEFIHQLDETDGSSAMPPAVLRILNFKACRGAIMFGDALLPSECCLIIEELKETSLCFQCAHGRPTTVPIVNIASLHDELGRLEVLSGRRTETWHGLVHHGPSLERAQTRLKQLRKLRHGL